MANWQLQEAKAQLSEVVRLCADEGPQILTIRGKAAAVILSTAEYEKILGKKQKFTEFIANSPLKGVELKVKRDRSKTRKIAL
jgi:prevent-host-death family protein